MPRPAGQSDFVIRREPAGTQVELPEGADPIALPEAIVRTSEATATQTRWVMWFTLVMLVVLVLMLVIGPHIPAGE